MNKQAYLIMAHNDIYILKKLLLLIDNKNNDIYLHLDKKMKDVNLRELEELVEESNLYFVKRKNVKWSAYSQIECEVALLKESTKNNKYSYYHLLSGVDLLLKSSDDVYQFFENKKGTEFVSYMNFDDIDDELLSRIKYYHFFNGNARHKIKIVRKMSNIMHQKLISIQKKLKVNRLKHNDLVIRKGANWFSITDDLARYIISCEDKIKKMFKHTNCADEIFLQTLAYNSKFKNKICLEYGKEHKNAKRHIDWKRGEPYTYRIDDYHELMNCDEFFARKFSSKIDKEIIDKIYTTLKGNKND